MDAGAASSNCGVALSDASEMVRLWRPLPRLEGNTTNVPSNLTHPPTTHLYSHLCSIRLGTLIQPINIEEVIVSFDSNMFRFLVLCLDPTSVLKQPQTNWLLTERIIDDCSQPMSTVPSFIFAIMRNVSMRHSFDTVGSVLTGFTYRRDIARNNLHTSTISTPHSEDITIHALKTIDANLIQQDSEG